LVERAKETCHSTAYQAGQIAKEAGVKNLLIGHFSSRYKDLTPFIDEARQVFDKTILGEDGMTIDFRDLA
jgi:ribonuclease Z